MAERYGVDWNDTEIAQAERLYDYLQCDTRLARAKDPLVILVAKVLGRTPASLEMKLANILDRRKGGGLPHGNNRETK
jgi:hypothetical protein